MIFLKTITETFVKIGQVVFELINYKHTLIALSNIYILLYLGIFLFNDNLISFCKSFQMYSPTIN